MINYNVVKKAAVAMAAITSLYAVGPTLTSKGLESLLSTAEAQVQEQKKLKKYDYGFDGIAKVMPEGSYILQSYLPLQSGSEKPFIYLATPVNGPIVVIEHPHHTKNYGVKSLQEIIALMMEGHVNDLQKWDLETSEQNYKTLFGSSKELVGYSLRHRGKMDVADIRPKETSTASTPAANPTTTPSMPNTTYSVWLKGHESVQGAGGSGGAGAGGAGAGAGGSGAGK